MTDKKDNIKKNKTLSLKLGSKPSLAPKRNIESGKTVIVEKKRYKRSLSSENETQKVMPSDSLETNKINKNQKILNNDHKKLGVVLKPLSKDQQKKLLKADSLKEKEDAIEKIRSGKQTKSSAMDIEEDPTKELFIVCEKLNLCL